MKTILVLAGGGGTDETVFETAFAAAAPLAAHLEFLHVRLSPGEAAAFMPHVDFARGPALRDAMDRLQAEAEDRSAAVARRFRQFCEARDIVITDIPSQRPTVSATLLEQRDDAIARMLLRARHNDLVVIGRAPRSNGLPADLAEILLLGCGRPLLIAPPQPPQRLTGTVLVCWKEAVEAARALTAAMPLLTKSEHVIVASVEEGGGSLRNDFDIAQRLAWHGISAEAVWMTAEGRPVSEQLETIAARYGADLVVMGGYGHDRVRELIFGGCTRRVLDRADRPVLLMH